MGAGYDVGGCGNDVGGCGNDDLQRSPCASYSCTSAPKGEGPGVSTGMTLVLVGVQPTLSTSFPRRRESSGRRAMRIRRNTRASMNQTERVDAAGGRVV